MIKLLTNTTLWKIKTLERLANDFYLIPTHKKRNADKVLSALSKDENSIEKILEIRSIAKEFLSFDDNRDYKIEELFHNSMKASWNIKKTLSNVMTDSLTEQYETISKFIPNNWIRLIGAGSGGYFLISAKIKQENICKLIEKNGIKGIIKASISNDGVTSLRLWILQITRRW